jgi:hypothetical protein
MSEDEFFIGWRDETPRTDRRFLFGASLALIAGGGILGASLSLSKPPVGDGVWDQGAMRTLQGVLRRDTYPALYTRDLDGTPRTVFLATPGKAAPQIDARLFGDGASVTGTLITRGRHAMMAVASVQALPNWSGAAALLPPTLIDRGPVMLAGEILDAKCWFGAMRPGYGKTHKACAALCARGGLPLAFCQVGDCADGVDSLLLVNENGQAFGRKILPLVADPVLLQGRLFAAGDVLQVRAPLHAIRRF